VLTGSPAVVNGNPAIAYLGVDQLKYAYYSP
jgi:hypothetical protein